VAVCFVLLLSACTTTATPSPAAGPSLSLETVIPSQPVAQPVPFPLEATIPELQHAMETGDLTAVELVDFYLARIAAYDDEGPKLKAFIYVNPHAREEAAALDAERAAFGPRGPMHGIPVVLKDNIGTADMPTSAGSRALKRFIPDADAFQVRKLRKAGAIIIGKTNMYEFAQGHTTESSLGGQTLSPYDVSRDPGGSSGGSAVAVTANFAVAGFGTDSCGSVRFPASLNDLYALRPTGGLSSRTGVIPLAPTLDMIGPMARSVVDLAIVLDATVGKDPTDPTTVRVDASYVDAVDPNGLSGRRVGILNYSVTLEVDQLLQASVHDMRASGAEFVEVTLPVAIDPFRPFEEFGGALHDYLSAQREAPSLRDLYVFYDHHPTVDYAHLRDVGRLIDLDTATYRSAIEGRAVFRDAVVALMDEQDLDAIFYPASPNGAEQVGADQQPYDCSSASYGGLPAMVVPAGFTSEGLPVGFELMGRPFAEPTLIAMAAGYEAHTDHRILPPTTPPL
jgi:Asp-tRNA(Asn)/Glu-tRNA(Gln) amidotransferase A subunit family amidase